MKVDRKDIESSLPRKGFRRSAERDHIYFHHFHQGRFTGRYTKLSHTAKMREVSGTLLVTVSRQLGLRSSRQAADLLQCPMDGDEYVRVLRETGVLPPDEPQG